MDIDLHPVTIREVVEGYTDDGEGGVFGYGGRLNIRPPYQREFVYKEKKRDAVIDTIFKRFPLNVFYWVENDDGTFEIATEDDVRRRFGALGTAPDAYLLGWRQLISPDPGHNPDHSFYYVMRGYWDDWWMRLRNQAGAGQPIDLEALPRRGYVEVILDGYRP